MTPTKRKLPGLAVGTAVLSAVSMACAQVVVGLKPDKYYGPTAVAFSLEHDVTLTIDEFSSTKEQRICFSWANNSACRSVVIPSELGINMNALVSGGKLSPIVVAKFPSLLDRPPFAVSLIDGQIFIGEDESFCGSNGLPPDCPRN